MSATPRRVFSMKPEIRSGFCLNSDYPCIVSIVVTKDDKRLVLADSENQKVKVVDLQHPTVVSASVSVDERPHALALLHDGLIAVTTSFSGRVIYLLTVTDIMTVTSRIKTDVKYSGVGGLSDGNLIVSCRENDNNGVSRVDIISRSGAVVRTITDSSILT
jgi:DNA-binding beta-propeller fold protein YncE